jgi:hypothetical protein
MDDRFARTTEDRNEERRSEDEKIRRLVALRISKLLTR